MRCVVSCAILVVCGKQPAQECEECGRIVHAMTQTTKIAHETTHCMKSEPEDCVCTSFLGTHSTVAHCHFAENIILTCSYKMSVKSSVCL